MRGIVPRVGDAGVARTRRFARYNRRRDDWPTGERGAAGAAWVGPRDPAATGASAGGGRRGRAQLVSRRAGGQRQRLHSTVRAMLDLSFGTPEDIRRAVGHINAIHDRVSGTLARGRRAVSCRHAVHGQRSGPARVGRCHRSGFDAAGVRAVRRSALGRRSRSGTGPRAKTSRPPCACPPTPAFSRRSQFSRYFAEMVASGSLAVSTDARAHGAGDRVAPWRPARCGLRRSLHRVTTVGLLPADLRDAYGFTWSDADDRALRRWARVIRASRRLMPESMALWPRARAFARDHASDGRHGILIEPLPRSSRGRASPPWPEWRNWQTRRTQNPVHRKVSVGSTPSSGTIPHSVRSGAGRAAQARGATLPRRQRARPPGPDNVASLGLVAVRAAQALDQRRCAPRSSGTPPVTRTSCDSTPCRLEPVLS